MRGQAQEAAARASVSPSKELQNSNFLKCIKNKKNIVNIKQFVKGMYKLIKIIAKSTEFLKLLLE